MKRNALIVRKVVSGILLVLLLGAGSCDKDNGPALVTAPLDAADVMVGTRELVLVEGGEPAAYAVALGRAPTATVTVAVTAANGNVVATPDTLNFTPANWAGARAVAVRAVDDHRVEGAHADTLTHTVSSIDPNYADFVVPSVVVNLTDDDSYAITVTPSELTLVEGGLPGSYSVNLTARPAAAVGIALAAVPVDIGLEVVPDTLVFTTEEWSTPHTVTVIAVADGVPGESPRLGAITHTVSTTDADYAAVVVPAVIVTTYDEPTPHLAIAGTVVNEGEGAARVMVRLSTAIDEPVRVGVRTYDGSARAGEDYTHVATTATFDPGVVEAEIDVPLIDDQWPETGEYFNVMLEQAENALIGTGGAVCYIEDDDHPVLTVADVSGEEGDGVLTFRVALTPTSPQDARVEITTVSGTAHAGEDYVARTATVSLPAGTTGADVAIDLIDDNQPELTEIFFLVLSSPENALIGDEIAQGEILNDDGQFLTVDDIAVSENDGAAVFALEMPEPTDRDVQVTVTTEADDAEAGSDFLAVSETVTIPTGATGVDVTVPLIDDAVPELTESFRLVLSDPVGAGIVDGTAVCTISDTDLPLVTAADLTVSENDDTAEFALALTVAAPWPVRVTATTEPATAVAPDDYEDRSVEVTFPAGGTEASVSVPIVNDTAPEGEEWFLLGLSDVEGAVVQAGPASCHITDNDFPQISVRDEVALEWSYEAIFTVMLDGPSDVDVTMRVDTQDITATEGADYLGWHGTLTIPAGRTAATVLVQLLDDSLAEPNERFSLSLTEAQNAGFLDAIAVCTIVDDE